MEEGEKEKWIPVDRYFPDQNPQCGVKMRLSDWVHFRLTISFSPRRVLPSSGHGKCVPKKINK